MIQLIVDVYNSRIDRNGNTYWAVAITDTRDRNRHIVFSEGVAGSNAISWLREMGFDWDELHSTEHELSIRQFERMTGQWPQVWKIEMLTEMMAAEGMPLGDYTRAKIPSSRRR
jgi:hypothetical protein